MPEEKRVGSVEGQRGQDDVVKFEACSCWILCEGGGESQQILAVVVSEEETACMANYHWCGMLIISISLSTIIRPTMMGHLWHLNLGM
jgi:hypothetical protein